MDFDWKTLLNFDAHYGKKIVRWLYYLLTALIAVNVLRSFIGGVVGLCTGQVFGGICDIIFCVPLSVVYFLVLRLICEMLDLFFDRFDQ